MPGMKKYVENHNPDDTNNHWAAPHPGRPTTAQKTRHAHERNDTHLYNTDTEDFDVTRSSLNDQDYAASDGSQYEEEYDRYDEQVLPIHQENGHHADGPELDSLMSQMRNDLNRPGRVSPNSYPPTTSGEPDPEENFEDQVDVEHPQAHLRVEQPRDLYTTKIPQRQALSTPLVIQPQPSRMQHLKDQYKVATKPTLNPEDVQHQKKSQTKAQAVFQPMTKHVPEQFQATPQTAAIHKSTTRVLDSAHQQPARVQPTTTNHRQQRANEADDHRQQYETRVEHQDQYLNNFDHQQQYGAEEPPEENYEQNTRSEEVLDYELEELYAKDFDELQNEPFDGPPREELHDTQFDHSKPLSERLAAVAKLDARRQKELFSSLKLEEWEEAGDWFQERFSEVFEKLKAARKHRREIAAEFEQRIAHRQQALTKKRKVTDDALAEMKKSGSLVLESTPKKKQRHTE